LAAQRDGDAGAPTRKLSLTCMRGKMPRERMSTTKPIEWLPASRVVELGGECPALARHFLEPGTWSNFEGMDRVRREIAAWSRFVRFIGRCRRDCRDGSEFAARQRLFADSTPRQILARRKPG